jgi:hypothetical protein
LIQVFNQVILHEQKKLLEGVNAFSLA